jgi:hypothetical protein
MNYDSYLANLVDDYLSECTPQYTSDGDYAVNCEHCTNIDCEYYEEDE